MRHTNFILSLFILLTGITSRANDPEMDRNTVQKNGQTKISVATSDPGDVALPYLKNDDELLYIQDPNPEIEPEGRIPIIMVHGWSFQGKPAPPGTGYWDFFRNYLLNDTELRKYFKPYYVKYWSNAVSVQELGGLMRNKLQEEGLHEEPFVIIAHSMGGLVSRSFMIENTFTSGSNSGRQCGENVKLLITLGSPHHGSPMANGPARDSEVNILLQLTMVTIEALVFNETKYNEVNRSNLHWDNYDGLLNYNKYTDERNDWLANLNTHTEFDSEMVCYVGTVDGEFLFPPYNTVEEQYKVGAYILKESFEFDNDGIVPYQSAAFEGHTPKRVRYFPGYNHADIVAGKESNNELFNRFKTDLLETIPIELVFPNEPGIYKKHSTSMQISWEAPSRIGLVNLSYSCDNGQTYSPIVSNLNASSGKYNWTLPDTNATQCLVKISNQANAGEFVVSETPFTIYHNQLTFQSPGSNEYFAPGRVNLISWLHEGIGDRVKITYSDTENNFEHIVSDNATTSPGNNTYEWMPVGEVPPTFSATLTVELLGMETFSDDTEVYRCNSEHFMFLGQPSISLLTPGTNPVDPFGIKGEQMVVDSLYNVTWETEGEIGFVRVSLCEAEKNILAELKKKSHKPGIAAKGSLNWKIPEYYGDLFFLFLEAGADIRKITATTFSEYPFRINRMPKVISPMQNDTGIGFLPCIEIEPLINATSYSVIITDTETNGDIYSNEFIADNGFFCLPAEMENELLPGKEYMLSAWAVIDTIQSYGTKTTFRTGENVPDGFSIIEPLDGDTLVEPENTFTWAHATGAMGYHLKITHLNNVIFEEGYSRADTQAVVNFGNVMYSDTLFCEITAHNDFGVNVSTISFYKKFRTGVENIAFKSTCNTKYGLKVVPNPVSEVSMVEFVLPNRGNAFLIKFKLFSSNGKQLFEGNEMMLNSGKHSFNLERLFSDKGGLYFLSLWVDGDLETTGVFFE